jgi:pantetheine-phosphate adenylyltransferase
MINEKHIPNPTSRKRGKFSKVAVGGTFDILHSGHKKLLFTAFNVSEKVLIGLTTDNFVHNLDKTHQVMPFTIRREELLKFLHLNKLHKNFQIIPINDHYGSAVDDPTLEAIVVSQDTQKKAQDINKIRSKRGFTPLHIIVIPLITANDGSPLSTSRIRRGEIGKKGQILP